MTAPDVRAFYAALGVELPAWAQREAPVSCFAQPDAHNHADRSPSCSVNIVSGAWHCHGCGASGGAYDAALAVGHTPRSAMELMIAYGLAEPRTPGGPAAPRRAALVQRMTAPAPALTVRRALPANDKDVRRWHEMLDSDSRLVRRLLCERAWSNRVIRELEIGFDGARITIPIRDSVGGLCGVLRYDPFRQRVPKMRAVFGTRLGLVPHPAREPSDHILLVEGPPDMIAARSCGLPAISVPGTDAWQPTWSELLAGRRVTLVMDCDTPGRRAAENIAANLAPVASAVEIADLWPDRDDGYDLTDRILERRRIKWHAPHAPRTLGVLLAPHPSYRRRDRQRRATTL